MLGDSITQGGKKPNEFSYRYSLFQLLVDEHICFDFVGTRNHPHKAGFIWPKYKGLKFDRDHEGYYGITTKGLLTKIKHKQNQWKAADIVLLHIGTNDRKSDAFQVEVVAPLKQIMEELRTLNPNILIFVSLLNQNYGNIDGVRSALQQAITWAQGRGMRVFPVQHNIGWIERPNLENSDTLDWVHPNMRGQDKMASVWFKEMEKHYAFSRNCRR
ncbi:MAG: hypothetical protein Alis3KO_14840 [Aliiglaciecola sp.]